MIMRLRLFIIFSAILLTTAFQSGKIEESQLTFNWKLCYQYHDEPGGEYTLSPQGVDTNYFLDLRSNGDFVRSRTNNVRGKWSLKNDELLLSLLRDSTTRLTNWRIIKVTSDSLVIIESGLDDFTIQRFSK